MDQWANMSEADRRRWCFEKIVFSLGAPSPEAAIEAAQALYLFIDAGRQQPAPPLREAA